ncbi:phage major capsid protein [Rhodococcus hoagii]|nr:phage major capsid protein [Prescottella equi]
MTATTSALGVVGSLPNSSLVTPTTAETFKVEDLYKLEVALPPKYRANARFMANKSMYSKVRGFDQSGGSSLWTISVPRTRASCSATRSTRTPTWTTRGTTPRRRRRTRHAVGATSRTS